MTSVTVVQTAIRIASVIAETLANIIKAGFSALAAMCSIPIIGPFLGIAAMAAVIAAGFAVAGGFEEGGLIPGSPSTKTTGSPTSRRVNTSCVPRPSRNTELRRLTRLMTCGYRRGHRAG